MANDWFKFKQFMVNQGKTAMKVGTDGVLLGAWAGCDHARRILDIGSGTGLIALMMAQRYSEAWIDAVEIDREAASQAGENFGGSPWSHRLFLHHKRFQDFARGRGRKYDLIVANPPYFSGAKKAPEKSRSAARHDDTLPREELLQNGVNLLRPSGSFAVILPFDGSDGFIEQARGMSLYPRQIMKVRPVPNKPFSRILLSFTFEPADPGEEILVIESGGRHVYSDEYKRLTRDFYLAF